MIQLIPLPQKVSQLTGTFRLTQDTSCYFAPELQAVSHFFEELVAKAARFPLQNGNEMADIRFLYTPVSRKKAISSTAHKAASPFPPPHPPVHSMPSKPCASF